MYILYKAPSSICNGVDRQRGNSDFQLSNSCSNTHTHANTYMLSVVHDFLTESSLTAATEEAEAKVATVIFVWCFHLSKCICTVHEPYSTYNCW